MKIRFAHIMLFLAFAVAGCAAYFSIWGLSQLFAGASIAVICMASVLEACKIGVTTSLHKYWNKTAGALKYYLTTAVVVLMLITSAGIYGFLSNAYQRTANKLEIQQGQVGLLDKKKELFQKDIKDTEKIITTKNKRLDQLTNLRSTQESRLDSAKGNAAKDKVRADIQNATNEIQKLSNEIDGINAKNATLSDSIGAYTIKSLDITAKSEVSAEVGPLKYIADLTGYPMAKVVNVLILLFIFVFDPLAIALILMTNRIFEIESETVTPKPEETAPEPVKNDSGDIITESVYPTFIPVPATPDAFIGDTEFEKPVEESITEPEEILKPIIEEAPIEEPEALVEETHELEPVAEVEPKSQERDEEPIIEPIVEETRHREPVIPTGKVELKDLPEFQGRGYSVNVPMPKKSNVVERIGSNKVKDSDNNIIFKRR